MNHTQRAALLAAEEAFRLYSRHHATKGDETKARANMALAGQMSAALAEPEPADEPVGAQCKFDSEKSWGNCTIEHHAMVQKAKHEWPDYQTRLVYARPQRREPLTDVEKAAIFRRYAGVNDHDVSYLRCYRAGFDHIVSEIEAAHGIGAQP